MFGSLDSRGRDKDKRGNRLDDRRVEEGKKGQEHSK